MLSFEVAVFFSTSAASTFILKDDFNSSLIAFKASLVSLSFFCASSSLILRLASRVVFSASSFLKPSTFVFKLERSFLA
jgi:hypothetical protein